MTVYTDEVNIYNTDAIAQGIENAGAANAMVTAVGTDGVKVHPAGQSGSGIVDYTLVDANGVKLYKGGVSVASFGDSATIGKTNGPHTVIQSSGVDFYGASDGSVNLAHIGYASGNSEDGVATAPYYTFGERKTTTNVYSASSTYSVGDHVLYDGVEYVCTMAITSPEAWNSSHWTRAIGNYSVAEGYKTTASGVYSHAEGSFANPAASPTISSGWASHAEGLSTTSSSGGSHAEGIYTSASNMAAHAEGYNTTASGPDSHSEGSNTTARGICSHAQNSGTIAAYANQTAIGTYNDNQSDNAFEIGNGTSDTSRSNAAALTWDGALEVANKAQTRTNLGIAAGSISTITVAANSYAESAAIDISSYGFTSTPTIVVGFYSTAAAGGFGKCSVSVSSASSTSFKVRVFNGDTTQRAPALRWIAVGN